MSPRGLPFSIPAVTAPPCYPPLLQPKLCYQDLRSALLFNPKHPQAKGLLQVMVDQAKKSLQDASILAVQGKLHRALKRISCAIENNPLDPNLFLFRYQGGKGLVFLKIYCKVSGESLILPRLFLSLAPNKPSPVFNWGHGTIEVVSTITWNSYPSHAY